MKILLTGCAGFIASRVGELLLSHGHHVIGADNVNDAYDRRLKEWRLAQLRQLKGFEFHLLDIADYPKVRSLFQQHRFDAILNLAARAGVRQSIENPRVYIDTNVTGTLNLLELCKDFKVNKFVLASTSSLYGSRNPRPFVESANTDFPLSPYAASKKGAEALAATYHHLYQINGAILRYFTVYGPAGRPDMSVFRFIQQIAEGKPICVYGDGSQERDFTYVDDIARGTASAVNVSGFETINLGGDKPASLKHLIQTIEAHLGRKATIESRPFHSADMMATWADIQKAKKILDWHPHVSLDEGVQKSVEWYLQNRDWAKKIELGAL